MPTAPSKRAPLLPWWLKALAGLVVFALIVLGVVAYLGLVANNRYQAYATELRDAGELLTVEELDATRHKVPNERNGAIVLRDLMAELGTTPNDLAAYETRDTGREFTLIFGSHAPKIDLHAGLPRYAIEPTRRYVDDRRELLDALAPLVDMPRGRFEYAYAPNPFDTMLPGLSSVRTAAKLQRLDGIIRLVDGDIEGAATTAIIDYHISATYDEAPFLVSKLDQFQIVALGSQMVEDTLRVGEISPALLGRLRAAVEDRLANTSMKRAFRGERAAILTLFDEFAEGNIAAGWFSMNGGGGGLDLLPEFVIRKNQLRAAEMFTRLVEAADDSLELIQATKQHDREVPRLSAMYMLLRMVTASISRSAVLSARCRATLLCTQAGLAAEQYRLRTGDLPMSLADIIPDDLPAWPVDPFDGEPMRFVRTDDGITIYSIGEDLSDDGGSVFVIKQERRPRDTGFTLLDPAHRGLTILDIPAPVDDD